MRIVSIVYGIVSSMMFIGCVAGQESADTQTADEVDSEGSPITAIAVHGDAPVAGVTRGVINPHECPPSPDVCPPSLPSCGPVPGVQTTPRGGPPAAGAAGAVIHPQDCPPSWPSCGTEPGLSASAMSEPAKP
jgi:hypothetical protein